MLKRASVQSAVSGVPSPLTVVPLNRRRESPLEAKKGFMTGKRIFDLGFSLLFCIAVLSWLLPLLCLLVKISSKGPVFFLQKRVGLYGKPFTCYKLRTMFMNEASETQQASENDTRITRLGRFLRKTNIDEFPQFFNVLAGHMSIIGPRPHMLADARHFSSVSPDYIFRDIVRPGITGLAQIKGYHGPTPTRSCVTMRCYWDNYYIRNIGFALDAKILLYTIFQRMAVCIRLSSRAAKPRQPDNHEVLG